MKPISSADLHSYSENKMESTVLIDAGGGTRDVAYHEILSDFAVQDSAPDSGPWGVPTSTTISYMFVV